MEELEKPIYPQEQYKVDFEFVLKKLGLTETEFEKIMRTPPRNHYDFDYEKAIELRYPILRPIKYLYRKINPVK